MNRLMIQVNNLSQVLEYYDVIKVYRATSINSSYSEITNINTRITIIPEENQYFYSDDDGLATNYYKTSYYNISEDDESELSVARLGGTTDPRIGYAFKNYRPPPNEWGEVLTADDMRFHFLWGIDLVANDDAKTEVLDSQLEFAIENAVGEFEHFFNIDIRKRIYKYRPASTLNRSPEWREGVDYTDEEDAYDFDPAMWSRFGFLRLRHRPLISIESAKLVSPYKTDILDLLSWVSMYKEAGEITFYPQGSTVYGVGYAGSGILAAWPGMMHKKYPHGYEIDYTTGFPNSDYVPKDLRNAIGLLASINSLGWIGDGLMAGFSSSSVSLDGLSESFSSTQSATSAFFGARIASYIKQLEKFKKDNKNKYSNIPIGFA
jgi:hypothetical protein